MNTIEVFIWLRFQNADWIKICFFLTHYCKQWHNKFITTPKRKKLKIVKWKEYTVCFIVILTELPLKLSKMEYWIRNFWAPASSSCTIFKVHMNKFTYRIICHMPPCAATPFQDHIIGNRNRNRTWDLLTPSCYPSTEFPWCFYCMRRYWHATPHCILLGIPASKPQDCLWKNGKPQNLQNIWKEILEKVNQSNIGKHVDK